MLSKIAIRLRDSLLRLRNSFFGHDNYKKFIVITRSRTGSNLLISFLNSHPNVIAKGEVFRRIENKSSKDVWRNLFSKVHKNIKYVGCKIFYYHPLDSDDKEVWDLIKRDENIKIIHLTRKNMLRTVLSREIADKTQNWTNKSGKTIKLEDKRVELKIEDCFEEFKTTKSNENGVRNEYMRDAFLEVTYEDLVSDNQGTMNQIFDFLNIPETSAKSKLRKQNKEELKDLILNYDELAEAIADSEWSYLLSLA